MNKEDKSQQTETGNRQAVEILKALSHFEYPGDASQMQPWLEKTKPLQSLVKTLCEKDRSGRLTLDCVCTLFEVMATRGESVSPAVWNILEMVDDDDVKCLVEMLLKDHASPQLKNDLLALISGVCTCGLRMPKLQVWCEALIEALEEKQEYHVLQSVSQGVAFKLLHGIVLPHTRKAAFSLFERLLYPMTSPHAFNSLVDQLPEVLRAVENDEMWEQLAGLTKALLERFPPGAGKEESHKRLRLAVAKHTEGAYKPDHPVWSQKAKPATELSSILECPICYERFVTPITACENGHCICSNCKDRLKSCPICRGHISNIRMTIMDQIMEASEFPCKNFFTGCAVRLPYKDIWNHELDCEYRTVPCDIVCSPNAPKIVCNEDVIVLYFHEHMEKCHKASVIKFELNGKRRGELRRQKVNEVRLLKNSDGTLHFIERIYVTDDEIFFAYHYIGKSEDAKNYVYTLKINGGGVTQKIRYTNFCLPNYMGVFDTEVDERCLILEPEKIFFAQRTKFEYSVRIEEVKVYRMRLKKNKFLVTN